MHNYLPLLIVGAIIGVFTLIFSLTYLMEKNRKEELDFDRHMKDGELISRLMAYAGPYRKEFVKVFLLLLFSVVYDLVSPLLIGYIEETVKGVDGVIDSDLVYAMSNLPVVGAAKNESRINQKAGNNTGLK